MFMLTGLFRAADNIVDSTQVNKKEDIMVGWGGSIFILNVKELSLCHKLKFSNSYIYGTDDLNRCYF